MPVHVAIMMKYSDLLNDGSRSVGNYFDQLRRCSGLIPINVLATINNRWVINDPAHESWEAEFLSDSVRNKAARFRSSMPEEGIIFTRAGALLNLKLLLGMQPAEKVFGPTAIGAIALHANDYIESADTSRLASGTLPAIAEFAPAWELQNIRDPRQLLFRSSYLYALLREHERVRALFKKPLDDVPLAGLRFDQYFALLFGIYTSASNSIVAVPCPTSILDAADIAAKAGLTLEQFTTFAAAKSLTLAEAHEEFGPIVRESFAARVTSSSWTSDQRPFRRRPLLHFPDGRFLVLDLQFLFESASAGLTWTLMEQLNAAERKRFLNYWGDIFERYVQDLLTHYYTSQAPVNRTYPGDGQIDALLRVGDDLIAFEVKAGFLRDEAKGSRDPEIVDAAMRQKYVTDDAGKRVGVRQLVATAAALLAGKVPGVHATGRIYPILVGEDPILQTPAVNTYLNDIFREEIIDDRVCPLTVMLVDELEQLLPNIAADDVTWQELLTRRFNGSRVAAEPIHTTLIDLGIERGFGRRADHFLRKQSEMLIDIVKNAYKDLK